LASNSNETKAFSTLKKNERPIGFFDSGIGGLTVAAAFKKMLANESIVYFGDTAHLPYGDKSPESIRHYAARITGFLLEKKCKAIVIACNTASAHAFKTVSDVAGPDIPVINVIDPVANYVSRKFASGKIGVIGTKGTIESRVYVKRIEKLNERIKVMSCATPLLAPMIEEGFFNKKISQAVIDSYLSKSSLKGIEGIILGCTHYPLISKSIERFYNGGVEVIDGSRIVASECKKVLESKNLISPSTSKDIDQFFVSDFTESFEASTRFFFKKTIHLKEARIW
jgi:glutamate racemase